MPQFKYKIKEQSGIEKEGLLDAADRFALATDLRASGKTIISIHEVKKTSTSFVTWANNLLGRIKEHDLIVFSHNFRERYRFSKGKRLMLNLKKQ